MGSIAYFPLSNLSQRRQRQWGRSKPLAFFDIDDLISITAINSTLVCFEWIFNKNILQCKNYQHVGHVAPNCKPQYLYLEYDGFRRPCEYSKTQDESPRGVSHGTSSHPANNHRSPNFTRGTSGNGPLHLILPGFKLQNYANYAVLYPINQIIPDLSTLSSNDGNWLLG